jgi:hypothetical protein
MPTILIFLSLVVAFVALGYAWKLQQELGQATRRLDRYNRALFDANDELRRLREEMTTNMAQLRVEIMQTTGRSQFTSEMTVREAQLLHPQAQQVLAGLHLGGCSSCAIEPDDTLSKVSVDHGVDLVLLLANLNALVQPNHVTSDNGLQLLKLPNVALEF